MIREIVLSPNHSAFDVAIICPLVKMPILGLIHVISKNELSMGIVVVLRMMRSLYESFVPCLHS